jgi:hypothetical protein
VCLDIITYHFLILLCCACFTAAVKFSVFVYFPVVKIFFKKLKFVLINLGKIVNPGNYTKLKGIGNSKNMSGGAKAITPTSTDSPSSPTNKIFACKEHKQLFLHRNQDKFSC